MNGYCIVIPHYNHEVALKGVLKDLETCALPVVIVDDGSAVHSRCEVERLIGQQPRAKLLALDENQGKGGAILHGVRRAAESGFSHVVQLDADGQHTVADIPPMIEESKRFPDSIVSGLPIFGSDIPKLRLHCRKITNFLARIETLSGNIQDAMCGFRVYPVEVVLAICAESKIPEHMEFETELLVRACWRGTTIRYVPTRVRYPENGISHFRMILDNVGLTWMHIRLCLGMIRYLPTLLRRSIAGTTR